MHALNGNGVGDEKVEGRPEGRSDFRSPSPRRTCTSRSPRRTPEVKSPGYPEDLRERSVLEQDTLNFGDTVQFRAMEQQHALLEQHMQEVGLGTVAGTV
eukprot:15441876-Alexandrium_andersonii.AAC.1